MGGVANIQMAHMMMVGMLRMTDDDDDEHDADAGDGSSVVAAHVYQNDNTTGVQTSHDT